MLHKSSFLSRFAIMALALPMVGLPAAIVVNAPGATQVCTQGCTPDTLNLPPGGTSSGTFNLSITTNGDKYNVSGSYLNTITGNTGTSYFFDPTVTFVSSATGFTLQADKITVDMLQDYAAAGATLPIYWDSPPDYTEDVPFVLPANGKATAEACFTASSTPTTECLPTLSATASGYQSASAPLGTGTAQDPYLDGLVLAEDFDATFTFAKNTPAGAFASSPAATATPEPAQFIPAGIGLASLLLLKARQLRSKNAR